jgi:hypothetical protein
LRNTSPSGSGTWFYLYFSSLVSGVAKHFSPRIRKRVLPVFLIAGIRSGGALLWVSPRIQNMVLPVFLIPGIRSGGALLPQDPEFVERQSVNHAAAVHVGLSDQQVRHPNRNSLFNSTADCLYALF